MILTGLPITYGIDPWASESVQQLDLGSFGYDRFGNAYRYGQQNASTATLAGRVYASLAIDTNFVDMAVQAAAAIGAKTISVTLGGSSTTASQFTNGKIGVSVTPGIGQDFHISSHDVATNGTTCKFNIYETVQVALTTSSKVTVTANPYGTGIVINPATRAGAVVGVAKTAIPVSYYGWYQVQGDAQVLCDATVPTAIGQDCSPSTTTAGTVTKGVTLIGSIGTFYVLGVSAQCEPVFLRVRN